jgi:hypothetical protein
MKDARKKWPLVLILIVVVVSAAVWFGGEWLWHLFLKMHGIHGAR